MPKSRKAAPISLMATLLLSLLALTACSHPAQVVLRDSVTIRILPGDLRQSPEMQGWALSDNALAKLLEVAEKCQENK